MDTCIGYDDKLEKLQSLSIGKVRELLAYADGDERLDDWLDDVVPAFLDALTRDRGLALAATRSASLSMWV